MFYGSGQLASMHNGGHAVSAIWILWNNSRIMACLKRYKSLETSSSPRLGQMAEEGGREEQTKFQIGS